MTQIADYINEHEAMTKDAERFRMMMRMADSGPEGELMIKATIIANQLDDEYPENEDGSSKLKESEILIMLVDRVIEATKEQEHDRN